MLDQITQENYYTVKGYLSSSMLRDFEKCPFYFYAKHIADIWKDEDEDEPDYFVYGKALDCYITEGPEAFAKKYVVVDRRNAKAIDPREQLPKKMYANVIGSVKELSRQPLYKMFNGEGWDCQNIMTTQEKHEFTGEVIDFKGKTDFINKDAHIIADLKTTRSLDTFRPQDYSAQMARYRKMARILYGGDDWKVYIVAVDKTDMLRSAFWLMSDETIMEGERRERNIIEAYFASKESGIYLKQDDGSIHDCPAFSICPMGIQKDLRLC